MGKKAKLKKQRRQAKENPARSKKVDSNDFIGTMAQEGYRWEQNQRSPEVPKDNVEPQI